VAKFGQAPVNLIAPAADYGKRTQVHDFFTFGFNSRFRSVILGGGVDVGRIVNDTCFVVDSPQDLLYCRVVQPWSAHLQGKFHASYTFPAGIVVSSVFQSVPGSPISANYTARNAEIRPTLGRDLSSGPNGTATVPLIAPFTMFNERRNQLDLRFTKKLNVGSKASVQLNVDLYNALNVSPALGVNPNFGSAAWLRPVPTGVPGDAVLPGRLVEFGASFTF
jgi:hypothetical protein